MKIIAEVMRPFVLAVAFVGAVSCARSNDGAAQAATVASLQTAPAVARASLTDADRAFYRTLARQSWTYLNAQEQRATGLVNATPDWPNTTLWDVGGQLLAFHAAKELGLLSTADYNRRTARTLATLEKLQLYRGTAFNKVYSTKDGSLGDGTHGWSATDLGRLLVAIKIVSVHEPQFAGQLARIAHRIDLGAVVSGGYLHGQMIGTSGAPRTFQEGRIGYEQYAAAGFALWGGKVDQAADVMRNAQPVTVMGVPLLQDARGDDRLLSEPFILFGLELGLSGAYRDLAIHMLNAQRARFDSTGMITIATEDAIAVAPDFFYYYCVYCGRKAFVVDVASTTIPRNTPRWVSTKGAFGWQAILPDDYTRRAVDYVAPALDAKQGWASGVFEGTRTSTRSYDINTAAMLMEIAFFQLRGGTPLLASAAVKTNEGE